MTIDEFITFFADQFDDTDPSEITSETYFRELEEWSSLIGLAVMNIVSKKYNVKLNPEEFKSCETVEDIYRLIQTKL